jgi:hypothetical protein
VTWCRMRPAAVRNLSIASAAAWLVTAALWAWTCWVDCAIGYEGQDNGFWIESFGGQVAIYECSPPVRSPAGLRSLAFSHASSRLFRATPLPREFLFCSAWRHLGFAAGRGQYRRGSRISLRVVGMRIAKMPPISVNYILVPYWLPCLATAVLPATWLQRRWRRRNRFGPGFCPSCGYDLRATPHRCPECGRHQDWRRRDGQPAVLKLTRVSN